MPGLMRPPSPTLPAPPSLETTTTTAQQEHEQTKWSNPSSVESNALKTDSSAGEHSCDVVEEFVPCWLEVSKERCERRRRFFCAFVACLLTSIAERMCVSGAVRKFHRTGICAAKFRREES